MADPRCGVRKHRVAMPEPATCAPVAAMSSAESRVNSRSTLNTPRTTAPRNSATVSPVRTAFRRGRCSAMLPGVCPGVWRTRASPAIGNWSPQPLAAPHGRHGHAAAQKARREWSARQR